MDSAQDVCGILNFASLRALERIWVLASKVVSCAGINATSKSHLSIFILHPPLIIELNPLAVAYPNKPLAVNSSEKMVQTPIWIFS